MLDLILSFGALIVLFPILLVIGIIIFLGDFHNPIFVQERLTKHGKRFKMYKFRSMCVNAEEKLKDLHKHNEVDGPAFKMDNDPRVTKIGKFIRKTSIDELPQLLNIIAGDMSIVGPRPPLPSEVEQYTEYQMHRLDVKTGLTCFWQCSGRSNISFDEWVALDVKYIKEMSFATDTQILFKTIKAVLKRDGAK
ncbi:MAG: sugar transferase [Clostridiales bacterium]|nr:sugar transferase [Clostridiales bacterium]